MIVERFCQPPPNQTVNICTPDGRYTWLDARHVVVCAGPWLAQLLPDLPVPLRVEWQVAAWFAAASLSSAPFAAGNQKNSQ